MGQFKDLSGQHFGEITVLCKDEELSQKKKRVYWKCKCSCGREKSIRGDGLKHIQTCGECTKDLTNQRFGRLMVLNKGKKDKAQHQFWFCKCDCGIIVEVNSDNLRRGLTQSCGCLHSETTHAAVFKDLTNKKFGKLTPLFYETINNKVYWTCQCECGNIHKVSANNLINGHTQSCGCIRSSIGENNIASLLNKHNIFFIQEYTPKDLPGRRYDFYLPEHNRLIEFDGKQHFVYTPIWHNTPEDFEKAKERDQEKNIYALSHNISLVRIPYTERDNITLEMIFGNQYLV